MKKILTILFIVFSMVSFGQGAFQGDGRFAPTGNYFITKFGEAQTGFWPIARYTQRDSIPQWQLTQGMIVYAADRDSCYQLTSVLLRTWYSFKLGSAGDLTNYYTKTQADSRYLQSYTETDPIYTASSWYGTTNNSGNWNTAYSKRLSSAGLTSSTLTLTLADASTVTASVPTFNQNTTGSAATLGTSRYIYGNLFNGSADITSTISDTYIASADNWNTAYTNRIATANSPLSISSNTLSIAQAGTGTDGFLSATDWNTFNSKQNALGYTPENNANKAVAGGYASLDGSGKIPTSQLPNLAMNNVWTVSSQSAMLALSDAVVGDVAVRSDSSITYVLKEADYTHAYNWVQLLFPTAPVLSVNGQTGNVSLTTSNISEGSNMYYTDARARAALSVSSGSAAYNSSTGVISIPTNNNQLTNGGGYISNITGLLTAGSNTSLSGSGTSGSPYVVNIPQSVATTASPTFASLNLNGSISSQYGGGNFFQIVGANTGHTQFITIDQAALKIGWGTDTYRSGIENAGEGGGNAGVILRSYNGNIYLKDQNDATAKIVQGTWNGTAIADTYISSASIWNSKQGAITLTTTGSSGAATFSGNTLNIPTYTLAGLGGISGNQTITLGGILSGSGTTSITASAASGYYMPTTTDQSNWNGKQSAIANGTGFLKNNGSGTWSYDNSNYLHLSAGSLYPLTNSLYFAKDGGVSIASKNAALNAYDILNFYASSYSFNNGDFYIIKDNATFTLSRGNGNYGLRISQDNTVGSISFNTKLSDNSTWQPYIKVGEGNSSSSSHLYLQPINGNTYIGSSAAFSVSPNGALNGTSASFSSSVTASSFIGNLNYTLTLGTDLSGTSFNNSANVTANVTSTLQSVTGRGASTSNAITISNTTNATSYTTGALIISGGIGVAKDIYSNGYGTFVGGGGTSDPRWKTNVKLHNSSILDKLVLREFNFFKDKINGEIDNRVRYGFYTTDFLGTQYNSLVFKDNADKHALNYSDLHSIAIIELRDETYELKKRITYLEQVVKQLGGSI